MSSAKSEIEKLHHLQNEAYRNRNAKAIADLWERGGKWFSNDEGLLKGKAAIRKNIERWISTHKLKVKWEEIEISGPLAYEYGTYEGSVHAEGSVYRIRGHLMRILHRQKDGSWKIARAMANQKQKLDS